MYLSRPFLESHRSMFPGMRPCGIPLMLSVYDSTSEFMNS